jgi:hypothetical protein
MCNSRLTFPDEHTFSSHLPVLDENSCHVVHADGGHSIRRHVSSFAICSFAGSAGDNRTVYSGDTKGSNTRNARRPHLQVV